MRTKKEIIRDYQKFLLSNGFDCRKFSDEMMLEMLIVALYETEDYKGQKISTTKAFWHFCRFVLHIDPASGRTIWNPFVKELFEMIEKNRLTSLMAPRSGGKSYVIFILYPLFKAFLWEYFEAILCSNIPKMTKRNFRVLIRLIETNELLLEKKNPAGARETVWTKEEIEYNRGFIEAVSMGSTPRSAHVNYIAGDDPLRDDRKYTDEYNLNFFLGQLLPCIRRRRGRMVIDGTPQHEADLFHTLMKNKDDDLIKDGGMSTRKFYSKVFDAIVDEEKELVLQNNSFTWKGLMNERDVQGDLFFMREYRCKCISQKQAIFPEELIKNAIDDGYEIELVGEEDANYIMGCDLATSGAASADFSGFVILKILKKGDKARKIPPYSKVIVKVVQPAKGTAVSDQIDKIEDLSKDFNAMVFVERNNIGPPLIQELQNRGVNVKDFVTDRIKKNGAIAYLQNELKHRRLIIPANETAELKKLKDELRSFGVRRKRNLDVMEALTGHDDLVDALWIVNKCAQNLILHPSTAILQD